MRVTINIADAINDWFTTRSIDTGISKSALMAMALSEYIDQKEGLKAMAQVQLLIQELSQVKGHLEEKGNEVE